MRTFNTWKGFKGSPAQIKSLLLWIIGTIYYQYLQKWGRRIWQRIEDHLQQKYFVLWYRDCDCAESTTGHKVPAYRARQWCSNMRKWYGDEGPCTIYPMTKNEYEEFKPSSRDRILEAFEDGRGSHVII